MKFASVSSEIFIPDGSDPQRAFERTTDLCIAAHHDDIEIMAYAPICTCFETPERYFSGCVVSDGAGSPRSGVYEKYTDEEMKAVRLVEQKKAAMIGNYSAQVFLALSSAQIKDAGDPLTVNEIEKLLLAMRPDVVYTHNLADKHDTHVSVALRVIEALRKLPREFRPKAVYSMEVWRGLDWLCDSDKSVFDTSGHPNLAAALLGVFDSQIAGGKRYDSAALGRRLANATFFASHDTDKSESLSYAMDITPLMEDKKLTPSDFLRGYFDRFETEIINRIDKFGK